MDADRRRHDIDDRIRGAHFVEVNLVGDNAVDLGFRFSQTSENFDAGGFDLSAEFAALDQLADLFPRS